MVTLGHEGSQRHSALGQLGVEIWANMRFGSVCDIVVQVEATECHLQQLADVAVALEKSFHLDARLLVHGQGGGWAEILHQLDAHRSLPDLDLIQKGYQTNSEQDMCEIECKLLSSITHTKMPL